MISETEPENEEKIWKTFLRKHWKMVAVFVVGAIIAFTGAILVYLWFVEEAQLTALVPATLDLWAMGHVISFILYLILWEILLIGIPVLIAVGAIYILWWNKIPEEERKVYKEKHLFGKRSKSTDGGQGVSFLVFIAFLIKIYLDGNWNEPFANWTFDYLVHSCIIAFIWIVIIIGIPLAIGGTLWLGYEMKKNS